MPEKRVSLVAAVAEEIRALLGTEFTEGQRLPGESELALRLNVSRPTLREAISVLWHEGLLQKKWGVGTVVLARGDKRKPGEQLSLALLKIETGPDKIRASGAQPGVAHVSISRGTADALTASLLDVAEGAPVWFVDRVLTADEEPLERVRDMIPAEIKGRPFDATRFDALAYPLFTMLRELVDCEVERVDGALSAVAASTENAALLGVTEGCPLLLSEQTTYARDGTTLAFSSTWYRSDKADLRFSQRRQPGVAIRHAGSKLPIRPPGPLPSIELPAPQP